MKHLIPLLKYQMVSLVGLLFLVAVTTLNITVHAESYTQSNVSADQVDSSEFAPKWLIEMMDEKAQNNQLLKLAFQDYLAIENQFDYLDVLYPTSGSSFREVKDNFKVNFDNVEIREDTSDDSLQLLSYIYRDEVGNFNPETGIEDWANIVFYFVNDQLVYSGVGSMSLSFSQDNAIPLAHFEEWFDEPISNIEALLDVDQFQLYAISHILVNNDFIYGLGSPVESDDSPVLPNAALIYTEQNDQNETFFSWVSIDTFDAMLQSSFADQLFYKFYTVFFDQFETLFDAP